MPVEKLNRKQLPAGLTPQDFTYQGRPAKEQGDFGPSVGIADLVCVNQFGERNNSKMYHGGVVKSKDGSWWVYLEWGRVKPGVSWEGSRFHGQDYQFVRCSSEEEARDFFSKQLTSKNIKRLERRDVGGVTVWAGKKKKDGYLVQSLATREKGLPDALLIKDSEGTIGATGANKTVSQPKSPKASLSYQPQVVSLVQDLLGGVQTYTRALSQASGVTPTLSAIAQVRDSLIPAAMDRIKSVGNRVEDQVHDQDLRSISSMVYSLVPRYIPRQGISEEEAILSGNNILSLQKDLDAFESAIQNADFSAASTQTFDVESVLNARVTWLDPRSPEGTWVRDTFLSMSNNRHRYLSSREPRILNMFSIERRDRDQQFMVSAKKVAALRKGHFGLRANLQPRQRKDLGSDGDLYALANVILTQHGTRSVNVAPIVQTHFRLPRSLPGAQITGANFGHGCYYSTDFRKAAGYTSSPKGYWTGGGGNIAGRGAFMFLCDMIMGDAYRAPTTGSWSQPPNRKDSVFGVGGDRGHRLVNDEHIVFNPHYARIRYLMELDF